MMKRSRVRCSVDLASGESDIRPLLDGFRTVLQNQRRQAGTVEGERELLLQQLAYFQRIVRKLAGAGTNYELLLEPTDLMLQEAKPEMLMELTVLAFLHAQLLYTPWLTAVGSGLPVDEGLVTLGIIVDAKLPEAGDKF